MRTAVNVAVLSGATGTFRLGPFLPGVRLRAMDIGFNIGAGATSTIRASMVNSLQGSVDEGDSLTPAVDLGANTSAGSQQIGLGHEVTAERPYMAVSVTASGAGNLAGQLSVEVEIPLGLVSKLGNRKIGGKKSHFLRPKPPQRKVGNQARGRR